MSNKEDLEDEVQRLLAMNAKSADATVDAVPSPAAPMKATGDESTPLLEPEGGVPKKPWYSCCTISCGNPISACGSCFNAVTNALGVMGSWIAGANIKQIDEITSSAEAIGTVEGATGARERISRTDHAWRLVTYTTWKNTSRRARFRFSRQRANEPRNARDGRSRMAVRVRGGDEKRWELQDGEESREQGKLGEEE